MRAVVAPTVLLALAGATLPAASAPQGRDLDGNIANGFEAYYDSHFNISWLADASSFATAINTLPSVEARANFVDAIINRVWLVRDGDVSAVPEPASALLFGAGLAALLLHRRRRML